MTQQKQASYEPFFEQLLNLARLYSPSALPVPEGSRGFWIDVITGHTPKAIKAVLSQWAREQTRMIMPADLAKKLADYRSDKLEQKAMEIEQENQKPLPDNVAQIYRSISAKVQARIEAIPNNPTLWARRLMIWEAYGFELYSISAQAWREALGFAPDYAFDDKPQLPVHTGKHYVPTQDAMDGNDPRQKFMFFYEHEYKPGVLEEGAEWIFDVMNAVTGDYRDYYEREEAKAA